MSTGTPTPILGLNTYNGTDAFLESEVDANSMQIDTLPPTVCTSATRPTTNLYQGRYIWETDTKKLLMYDKSTTTWKTIQNTTDTGWLQCTPTAGWSHAGVGSEFSVRQLGEFVSFRGGLTNSTFTGGYTVAANLPAAITKPGSTIALAVTVNNASLNRSVQVGTDGTIQIAASAANASGYYMGGGYLL